MRPNFDVWGIVVGPKSDWRLNSKYVLGLSAYGPSAWVEECKLEIWRVCLNSFVYHVPTKMLEFHFIVKIKKLVPFGKKKRITWRV